MASRAETLDRTNRELYDKVQQWERLNAWPGGKNPDGSDRMLTGPEAVFAQRSAFAQTLAANRVLRGIFADPASAAKFASVVPTGELDAENQPTYALVWNTEALESLKLRLENEGIKAQQSAREHLATLSAPPPPPEATIAEIAPITIKQIIKDEKIEGLIAADETFLAGLLERYVQQTPKGRMVDPAFVEVMKDRAALRAEQRRIASTSKTADTFNGGMNKGRQGAAPAARPPAPPAPALTGRNAPKARTEPSANDIWAGLVEEARSASA
jgi:hypothetical protein